ncbi:MAG: hypothetical protein M3P43_02360 [Actinomycetota bacterium]|nr:hypothetical protein [Actinomycetota bacterium]
MGGPLPELSFLDRFAVGGTSGNGCFIEGAGPGNHGIGEVGRVVEDDCGLTDATGVHSRSSGSSTLGLFRN